jgi:hypothetical protein
MNDIFDFRRFRWYARKEWSETWKVLALSVVAASIITALLILQKWIIVHNVDYDIHEALRTSESLVITFILGIMMASSFVWRAFSNKTDAFAALTLPVSVLERFVFAWIIAVPFTFFWCFLVSKIMWELATPFFLRDFPKLVIRPMLPTLNNDSSDSYGLVFFLVLPALFMWGALTLGRLNFLKTLGIMVAAGFVFFLLQSEHLKMVFPNAFEMQILSPFPMTQPRIYIESAKGVYYGRLFSTFEEVYRVWWVFVVPVVLYASVFFKLKEKEI